MPQADLDRELVVLVDDAGHRLGTADKATVHGPHTPLHLGFSCYVIDPAGEVLLTRRAPGKRTFGGVWTNSFCGHPGPGERLVDAVCRRAGAELGIPLVPEDVDLVLPDFRYRAEMAGVAENELCPVVVARPERRPQLAPEGSEVAGTEWVPWAWLRRRRPRGPPACLTLVRRAGAPPGRSGDRPALLAARGPGPAALRPARGGLRTTRRGPGPVGPGPRPLSWCGYARAGEGMGVRPRRGPASSRTERSRRPWRGAGRAGRGPA